MRKKYFTRLTSRESVKGLLCLREQLLQYDYVLSLYLEEKFIHLHELCQHILGVKNVLHQEPSDEFQEIKINSLFLNDKEIVELDEPWISLHARCSRNHPTEVVDLHNTWWKFLYNCRDAHTVKDSMSQYDTSLKHFPTIKKLVEYTRREKDYQHILKLYNYINDNQDDVISELNSRWLISITQSLCELKKHGHQFVLLLTLMRTIQVYHSKLFTYGVYFRDKDDEVKISHDSYPHPNAKYIPKAGWTVLWDGLQIRFENDHVFETIGKNIDGVMTNKICKKICKEFINRMPEGVMNEGTKKWILND